MRGRPAETGGAVGAVSLLLGVVLGIRDAATLAAWGTVVGLLPAAITLLVANGGVRGVLRLLWQGRGGSPAIVCAPGLFGTVTMSLEGVLVFAVLVLLVVLLARRI